MLLNSPHNLITEKGGKLRKLSKQLFAWIKLYNRANDILIIYTWSITHQKFTEQQFLTVY